MFGQRLATIVPDLLCHPLSIFVVLGSSIRTLSYTDHSPGGNLGFCHLGCLLILRTKLSPSSSSPFVYHLTRFPTDVGLNNIFHKRRGFISNIGWNRCRQNVELFNYSVVRDKCQGCVTSEQHTKFLIIDVHSDPERLLGWCICLELYVLELYLLS